MVRIQIEADEQSVSSILISGHAQSGPYGADLVCCAVSSIAISALNAIDELYPNQCLLECADNRIRILVQNDSLQLQSVLRFVCRQLECICEGNPKFVKIRYRSPQF